MRPRSASSPGMATWATDRWPSCGEADAMPTEAAAKPLPEPTRDSKPYWDGLNEGRLLLQQCAACMRIRHYPRPVCDACYSMEVAWIEASGRGRVHSWTVAHHPFHPGFKEELPYIVAIVAVSYTHLRAHETPEH